eukprot:1155933-Pelagomonas_calceolata.AAC.2
MVVPERWALGSVVGVVQQPEEAGGAGKHGPVCSQTVVNTWVQPICLTACTPRACMPSFLPPN